MAEAGLRIGAYRLVERLLDARGTELWRAKRVDPELSGPTDVVLRLVDDPDDMIGLDHLRREHEHLRVLGDSRIPRVLAFYEAQRALVVEYVQGTSLEDLLAAIRHGELLCDACTAVDIILEVAHGLRHAHSIVRDEGKILHGHLQPNQVRLTDTGEVKILGIGVSPDEADPSYSAPELANGQPRDERTDQWQVGSLLYELITHQPLYPGSWGEARQLAQRGDVTRQLDAIEGRYPSLTSVLRKVLAVRPADRYQVESTFLRSLLTASRSIPGNSRRRTLGAEAARIEPIRNPALSDDEEVAPSGWSRVGSQAESGGPLFFNPLAHDEHSEYELAEQMAGTEGDDGMAWVDLPKSDRTPLPDVFSPPEPARVQVSTPPSPTPDRSVNRPRSPRRVPTVVPGVEDPPATVSLEAEEARVDDLRDVLGGGSRPAPSRGAASLSIVRVEPEGTEPPQRGALAATEPAELDQPDVEAVVPDLEPTTLRRGPELDFFRSSSRGPGGLSPLDWEETPTDPGVVRAVRAGQTELPTDLDIDPDAFGMDSASLQRNPLLGTVSEPLATTEPRWQWGLFWALSLVGCVSLWAFVAG